MPKLTVIILTRNEERNLNACLESLRDLGDEIIVLDSSSEDRTCDIAKSRGARVFEAPPSVQGFGQRRRYAVMKAKNDVVLHLDADERLSAEGVAELKQAVAAMERTTVIALPRLTYLFGTPMRHSGWFPDFKLRVYDRRHTNFSKALVHEDVELKDDSKVVRLEWPILHYSYPTLEDFYRKQASYPLLWGEEKAARGRRVMLWTIPFRALFFFFRTYFLKLGFLDGCAGLWLAIANMGYAASKFLSLYQLSNDVPARPVRSRRKDQ